MSKVYKKWLFVIVSFLAIQHPSAVSAMNTSAPKKKSYFGYLGGRVKYLVDTIKSDLSIGDTIVQHKTLASQLGAAGRLVLYGISIKIGLASIRGLAGGPEVPRQFQASALMPGFIFAGCTLIPIIEEALFTYIPQKINNTFKEYGLEPYNIPPTLASILFGLGHCYSDNSYFNYFVMYAALTNYINQRYMIGRSISYNNRNGNLVPIYSHCLNNTIAFTLLSMLIFLEAY